MSNIAGKCWQMEKFNSWHNRKLFCVDRLRLAGLSLGPGVFLVCIAMETSRRSSHLQQREKVSDQVINSPFFKSVAIYYYVLTRRGRQIIHVSVVLMVLFWLVLVRIFVSVLVQIQVLVLVDTGSGSGIDFCTDLTLESDLRGVSECKGQQNSFDSFYLVYYSIYIIILLLTINKHSCHDFNLNFINSVMTVSVNHGYAGGSLLVNCRVLNQMFGHMTSVATGTLSVQDLPSWPSILARLGWGGDASLGLNWCGQSRTHPHGKSGPPPADWSRWRSVRYGDGSSEGSAGHSAPCSATTQHRRFNHTTLVQEALSLYRGTGLAGAVAESHMTWLLSPPTGWLHTSISMATVMGPTPPGTGVMNPALWYAEA